VVPACGFSRCFQSCGSKPVVPRLWFHACDSVPAGFRACGVPSLWFQPVLPIL
jgi:hypothetical protein